jgi:hypothetical protein
MSGLQHYILQEYCRSKDQLHRLTNDRKKRKKKHTRSKKKCWGFKGLKEKYIDGFWMVKGA